MTHCHTLRGHVSDHAHRICWTITRIREKEVDKTFKHNMDLLTKEGGPKTQNLQQEKLLYLCKSVEREYL